jgi:phage-related protein
VTVKNEGNTNVTGVFQVFGPVTASVDSPAEIVKTTGEGGSIKIIDSLTSNQILEIDTLNREVLLLEGNTVLSGRFKTATLLDWIYLDPGENTLSYSGAGSCRLLYRSGWIG